MRSLFLLLFLGAAGCSMATSASITPTSSIVKPSNQAVSLKGKNTMNLNSYQWKNRLLLVFAPSENHAAYQQQMRLFEGQKASFDERNLLVIDVLTEGANRVEPQEAAKIRAQFNISHEEFRVVLVGKDGTSKRRDNSPVSPKVIFETIDAMPRRRQEMRRSLN